ncbi:MAG: hypothetical protein ACI4BD_05805 [Paludibacteraceae bacterium]
MQHRIQRGSVQQIRKACAGKPALVSVDSLPATIRVEVLRRYGDKGAAEESRKFVDTVAVSGEAAAWYAEYKIDGVRGLDSEKQMLYVHNAAIMDAFRSVLERGDEMRMKVSKPRVNRGEFWARAAKALPYIGETYRHNLPMNARRLQQKYNAFFKDGCRHYEVFVSGKYQNANASAVQTEEQEALMVRLIGDHRNLDNEQVARLYNTVGEKLGWKRVTAKIVGAWRERYDLETASARLGKNEFNNVRTLQVSRRAPSTPMLLWSVDGWDAELYYQKRNEKGVVTYSNRLTVVVVLDAFNKYPIGYAIGEQECVALITEALRNAMNHTAQLFGRRYKPDQIQSDRYAKKAMPPIYAACADKYIPARLGNAKAKPIERYFKTINQTYCQLMPQKNWSGYGITADKHKQPNSDALNAYRHEFPDEEGCRKQIDAIIAAERQKKIGDYMKGWAKVRDDLRRPMTDEQYLLTFGSETGYKNALEGSGLNVRILGQRRQYDTTDIAFRQYSHIRWNVKYDPEHLENVLAVNDDGSLRFVLHEKHVQPMALADRQEGDAEALAAIVAANKRIEAHVTNTLADAQQKVEVLFRNNPQLDNVLTRALIVDSTGQHKDRRNDNRLRGGKILAIEEAQEIEPRKQSTWDLY